MSATDRLDRYRYISTLGSGGMATVVLAEDTMLGRQVALKRLNATGDIRGLSRLRREALVGAGLSHPNLVAIYDVIVSEDGEHTIVMEYVPGETLRDALVRGPLETFRALRVLEGAAAALDAIHGRGVVHRDVKPANILLGARGTVKLADLGIAAVSDRTRITTDGAVLGTFSYMAPEQLGGEPSTPAVDVYALAAVAFEALSGRKARTEPNPLALAHAISTRPPPDLREVWPEAPGGLAAVLIRGMAREPSARPRSAGELIRRLGTALEPQTTAPIPAPAPPRRRAAPAVGARGEGPARRRIGAAGRATAAGGAAAKEGAAVNARAATARGPADAPAGARERAPADASATARGRTAADAPAAVSPKQAAADGPEEQPRDQPPQRSREPRPALPYVSERRSRRAPLPAALIGLMALAAGIVLILALGGSSKRSPTSVRSGAPSARSSTARAGSSSQAVAAESSTRTAPAGSTAAAPKAEGARGPVGAVESFYGHAASHQYAAAWALADPTFRSQLGGFESFRVQQSGDLSIIFDSARVVSQSAAGATVAVQTTSVRKDGTQHCLGTVDLRPGASSAGWLVHLIHINCT